MKAEQIWFHVIAIIVLVLTIALCAINIYYFNLIRQNPTSTISKNVGLTMIILNAVVIVLALIVVIWAIARIVLVSVKSVPKIDVYNPNPRVPRVYDYNPSALGREDYLI